MTTTSSDTVRSASSQAIRCAKLSVYDSRNHHAWNRANPHANGGVLLRDLRLPDFRAYAVTVPTPGVMEAEATHV